MRMDQVGQKLMKDSEFVRAAPELNTWDSVFSDPQPASDQEPVMGEPIRKPFAYDFGLVISFYCRKVEKQIIKT